MRRLLTTIVVALCLGAATTATAAVKVTSDPPDDGPVAAGKRVVWGFAARTADGSRTTGALRVKSAVLGRRPHVIWRGRVDPYTAPTVISSLSASRGVAAFVANVQAASDLWAGPPARRARRLVRLPTGSPCAPRISAADTSGRRVAYAVRGCEESRIVVRGVGRHEPTRSVSVPESDLRDIAFAGRYLAWSAVLPPFMGFPGRDEIVVFDYLAGEVAYRANISAVNGGQPPGSPQAAFDLQKDGKLVVNHGGQPPGIAWFGPADGGQPHRVTQGVAAQDPVVARDVIATRLVLTAVLLDLQGRRLRTLHRYPSPFVTGSVGWDGGLATWSRAGDAPTAILARRIR